MERNIKKKVNNYSNDFKLNIQKWLHYYLPTIFVNNENKTNDFVQYMNDFPYLVLEKEDFQKRKRIKNNVPDYNRCIALKCNGERCSRKQKSSDTNFCGTHMKGAPHGTIEKESQVPKKQKVQLWLEEINGISRYIDENFNVYSSEDIINSRENPRIIAKYNVHEETGEYYLVH